MRKESMILWTKL